MDTEKDLKSLAIARLMKKLDDIQHEANLLACDTLTAHAPEVTELKIAYTEYYSALKEIHRACKYEHFIDTLF